MNLFQKLNKEKEYILWHGWRVTLNGKYELIDNDDSVQLINEDEGRVIYGSSFILSCAK